MKATLTLYMLLCCSVIFAQQNLEPTPNAITKDSLRTGLWSVTYGNGSSIIRARGYYVNGERDSIWTFYHKSGGIMATGMYRHGKISSEIVPISGREGRWEHYGENGQLLTADYWHLGLPRDTVRDFDDDDALRSIKAYKGDGRSYTYTSWHQPNRYGKQELYMTGTVTHGKPDGLWSCYYDNGTLLYRGSFTYDSTSIADDKVLDENYILGKAGGKTGEWNVYNRNGSPHSKYIYEKGSNEYRVVFWQKDSLLRLTGQVKNGKMVGEWRGYYPNGNLEFKGSFEYDSLYGESASNPLSTRFFQRGQSKIGIWTEYYNDGITKRGQMIFQKGKNNYISTAWYENGKVKVQGRVRNGHIDSLWRSYHYSGQLENEGYFIYDSIRDCQHNDPGSYTFMYHSDCKHGEWHEYNQDGHLVTIEHFDHGKFIGTSLRFDGGGDTLMYTEYKDGKKNGAFRRWQEKNGHLVLTDADTYRDDVIVGKSVGEVSHGEYEGSYDDGKLNGPYKEKDDYTGHTTEGTYDHGKKTGKWLTYSTKGKVIEEENYDNDIKDGPYLQRDDESLTVITRGQYKNDKKSGKWVYSFPTGDLYAEGSYDKGSRVGVWRIDVPPAAWRRFVPYLYGEGNGLTIYDWARGHYSFDLYDQDKYYTIDYSSARPQDHLEGDYVNGKKWIRGQIKNGWFDIKVYYPSGEPYFEEMQPASEANGDKFQSGQDRFKVMNFWDTAGHQLVKDGNGTAVVYEDGRLNYTETFKDGMRNGECTEYDEKGPKKITIYENGIEKATKMSRTKLPESNGEVSYQTFEVLGDQHVRRITDAKGNLTSVSYGTGQLDIETIHSDTFRIDYENGKRIRESYLQDGHHVGPYTEWYPSGAIRWKGEYNRAGQHGIWLTYLEDGTLIDSTRYENGQANGEHVHYYSNGKVKNRGTYRHGREDGAWFFYSEKGEMTKKENYMDGVLIK